MDRLSAQLGFASEDKAFLPPRMRLGSMPFDAWYSPFDPVGVDDLGKHTFSVSNAINPWPMETSRGIVYTTRGGFLDIAHLRNALDLTRFVYDHVLTGFAHGQDEIHFVAAEPDVYIVKLDAPDGWRIEPGSKQIPPDEAREAAIEVAGRVAYLMTTWHEVITWYGYKGYGLVTEQPSAFSYDDAASHRVGVEVAMRALRLEADPTRFDQAATAALNDYLHELGILEPSQTVERMEAVKGDWWAKSLPQIRVIDLGQEDVPLEARTVDAEWIEPVTWSFSSAQEVAGQRVVDLYDVFIEMKTFEASSLRRSMAIESKRPVHPRTDFEQLHDSMVAARVP